LGRNAENGGNSKVGVIFCQMKPATLSIISDKAYPVYSIPKRNRFSISIYPVISMDDQITHTGSQNNFIGSFKFQASLIEKFLMNGTSKFETLPTFYAIHDTEIWLFQHKIKHKL
jgi:hypothetical protein